MSPNNILAFIYLAKIDLERPNFDLFQTKINKIN